MAQNKEIGGPVARPLALYLAEQIRDILEGSGATQIEQFAALDVVRALVPLSERSVVEPTSDQSPSGDH